MKRYAKPTTDVSAMLPEAAAKEVPPLSDISIQRLIDSGLIALEREMRNLLFASAKGKLDAASARDLRDHMKLLFELKAQELDALHTVSDDDLKRKARQALDETE